MALASYTTSPSQVVNDGFYAAPTVTGLSIADIQDRLAELRALADEEEIKLSDASVDDLHRLFEVAQIGLTPQLFVLDNGNIKVSWRHSLQRHASFELLGGGRARPILFSSEPDSGLDNQIFGVLSVRSIPGVLRAVGLGAWILA